MTEINDYTELLSKITFYSNSSDFLFRGQVQNFSSPNYKSCLSTSFERQDCIPTIRMKWNYYCYNALKKVLSPALYEKYTDDKLDVYLQALMQHYGWQSSYLDISKNIEVSLFFAGYKFNQKSIFHGTEDFYESFLLELVNESHYDQSPNDYGYLYIFSKKGLENNSKVQYVDLTEGLLESSSRPVRQDGCLISTYPKALNEIISSSIIDVLKIKKEIIIDYCKNKHIVQSYLFPNTNEDLIYDYLLNLPRKKFVNSIANKKNPLSIYLKQFDLPEYDAEHKKIQSASVAFYSTFWLLDNIKAFSDNNNMFSDCIYYKCLEDTFYHSFIKKENCLEMPAFINLIRKQKNIFLEFDNLFKYFSSDDSEYQKGVHFELIENMIKVSEVVVTQVGKTLEGFGELYPRYYEIVSDTQVSCKRMENDCKCNDDDRHLHKLLVGKNFAIMILENPNHLKRVNDKQYIFKL